mmetsp:Transcript_17997/g.42040  ORF Transcript_17997/g.42040 Transcript_17997/m.42040 type:complete len:1060 (-) Transcript_17997:220-3399(-)
MGSRTGSSLMRRFNRHGLQGADLEDLLQGQQRLEEGVKEILHRVDQLSDQMVCRASANGGADGTESVVSSTNIGTKSYPMVPRASNETAATTEAEDNKMLFQMQPSLEEYVAQVERLGGYDAAIDGAAAAATLSLRHSFTKRSTSMLEMSHSNLSSNRSVNLLTQTMIHPASTWTSVMDVLRSVFMLIDVAYVPYLLAWQPPVGDFKYLALFVLIFWVLDIVINFRTGFIRPDGVVVMQPKLVAKHYIGRAFGLDVGVVAAEILDVLLSEFRSGLGSTRAHRALRFVKVVRFVRIFAKLRSGLLARIHAALLRWVHLSGHLAFLPAVDYSVLVLKLLFVIFFFGHLGACVWHGMEHSDLLRDEADSWRENHEGYIPSYIRGLYWAVSTVFSGSSHLNPLNQYEALLSVVWLALGAVFVTSVTSAMAATLIESHARQQEVNKQVQVLTSFLHQRHTPILLALAVHSDFMARVYEPIGLSEEDVALHLIAPSLRAALREHMYAPSLLQSAFFRMIDVVQVGLIQTICFSAAEVSVVVAGTDIFYHKQQIDNLFLVSSGMLTYTSALQAQSVSPAHGAASRPSLARIASAAASVAASEPEAAVTKINPGTLLCELSLLLLWRAQGNLSSELTSEMVMIAAPEFIKVVMAYANVALVVGSFSAQLCSELKAREAREGTPCDDVLCGDIDCDAVASNLPRRVRKDLLSSPLLESLHHIHHVHAAAGRTRPNSIHRKFADLEREVITGKCHLAPGPPSTQSHSGGRSVMRVVRLVLLRLKNKDGMLCLQLAHCTSGKIIPQLNFPGGKVLGNETPDEAMRRLLHERLHSLEASIAVVSSKTEVQVQPSPTFGIQTKYIKTIFETELQAHMVNEAPLPKQRSFDLASPDYGFHEDAFAPAGSSRQRRNNHGRAPSQKLLSYFEELVGEGSTHGFAVAPPLEQQSPRPGEQSDNRPHQELRVEPEVQLASRCSSFTQEHYVYQWLTAADIDNLHEDAAKQELESDLKDIFRGSSPQVWDRLRGWTAVASEPPPRRRLEQVLIPRDADEYRESAAAAVEVDAETCLTV